MNKLFRLSLIFYAAVDQDPMFLSSWDNITSLDLMVLWRDMKITINAMTMMNPRDTAAAIANFCNLEPFGWSGLMLEISLVNSSSSSSIYTKKHIPYAVYMTCRSHRCVNPAHMCLSHPRDGKTRQKCDIEKCTHSPECIPQYVDMPVTQSAKDKEAE